MLTASHRPGEVLLAPAFVGLCGTDLHSVHGAMDARAPDGVVLGHEASAVVPPGPGAALRRPRPPGHRRRRGDGRAVEPAEHRRRSAASLGLDVLDPERDDVPGEVSRWTGGAEVDASFEVSGSSAGADTALEALGVRGRLCLVGIHAHPRSVDHRRVVEREPALVGARLHQRRDTEAAIGLVAAGVVPARTPVTDVVPLARAADAVDLLGGGAPVTKLLIDCREGSST